MSIKFLSEGDWEWGGSIAWSLHGPTTVATAAPLGGWLAGGTSDDTFTPGPCASPVECCGDNPIPDLLNTEFDAIGSSSCTAPSVASTVSRNDADPDCPPGSACWIGEAPIASCFSKLLVVCEPGGTWAWILIGACSEGPSQEGVFEFHTCPPGPMELDSGGITCTCEGGPCFFSFKVTAP